MKKSSYILIVGLVLLGLVFLLNFIIPSESVSYTKVEDTTASVSKPKKKVAHIETPKDGVRAVYMTSHVAGYKKDGKHAWRDSIIKMINETELNSLVLDIKDDTGRISYMVNDPYLKEIGASEDRIPDIDEFLEELHEHGIYVIGRVSVFQDPYLVSVKPEYAVRRKDNGEVWADRKGLTWLDASLEPVWNYVSLIARESYERGFDEINFDYVRFPSDGDMSNVAYRHFDEENLEKHDQIREFFSYIDSKVRKRGIPTSADLFGMTAVAVDGFDLNIGQILEDALPHFDFVAPMVYPSHFPPGYDGHKDPNEVPYEIIKDSMDQAVAKAIAASSSPQKIRPWLQDFDYGGDYDAKDVRAQIQATYDAGLLGWMLWDPNVRYTPEALKKVGE